MSERLLGLDSLESLACIRKAAQENVEFLSFHNTCMLFTWGTFPGKADQPI